MLTLRVKPDTAPMFQLHHNQTVSKLRDEDDTHDDLNIVDVESGDNQQSEVNRSVSDAKERKVNVRIRDEFKARFILKEIGSQKIILGKPLSGNAFHSSGTVKIITELGFGPLLYCFASNMLSRFS